MGRGGTSAREINFVSFMAYGPNSDSALTMGSWGVTASETRQGGSRHRWKLSPLGLAHSADFQLIFQQLT